MICDGTAPSTCCQPALSDDERAWRLDVLMDAIVARRPRHCPGCGSDAILPLFWPDATIDTIECQRCLALFSGRGD